MEPPTIYVVLLHVIPVLLSGSISKFHWKTTLGFSTLIRELFCTFVPHVSTIYVGCLVCMTAVNIHDGFQRPYPSAQIFRILFLIALNSLYLCKSHHVVPGLKTEGHADRENIFPHLRM